MRFSPRRAALAVFIGIIVPSCPLVLANMAAAQSAPPLLAGVLPAASLETSWPRSGAWIYPVGDSLEFGRASDAAGYRINRGVQPRTEHDARHEGADLANGSSGGRVRAAAHGVVARVQKDDRGGYGVHVVLAHHLDDGRLVYSVYAHLARGSVQVHEGSIVYAGDAIARVGQTGRASTPHLHFEVRVPADSSMRWENCPAVDPVEFVGERLPTLRDRSAWSTTYLVWAELGSILPRGLPEDAPVDAELLRRLIANVMVTQDPDSLEREAGLDTARPGVSWEQVSRTLGEVDRGRHRLAPCPTPTPRRTQACFDRLGFERPARELTVLSRRAAVPTVADFCLVLADLAAAPPDLTAR